VAVVGEAFINLKSGSADEFTRDANGRLRAGKGKFEKAGEEAGQSFSGGFSKESSTRIGNSAKSLAKRIAVVLGGAYAVHEGIDIVKKAVAAGDDSRKIGEQTEAVIKSTGASANVTAAAIDRMATSMSLKTGIDDEAIQQGQNLLLTFTNIRNEAGKGNDVFDQSTKTLLDLATAMGTEPKAAAVQLGKALNDPTRGITALTKVGVWFTQQQKDQIKALQASGDLMGAQKIILGELNKEFGGSAEAQASAVDKIKVAAGNLQETLGKAIIPAIEAILPVVTKVFDSLAPLAGTLGTTIGQVIGALAPIFATLAEAAGPVIEQIGQALVQLAPAAQPLVEAVLSIITAFTPLLPIVSFLFATIAKAIAPVIDVLGQELKPVIEQIGAVLVGLVQAAGPALGELASVFVDLFRTVGPLLASLVSSFRPLMPIIGRVVAVLAGALGKTLVALAPVVVTIAKVLGGVLASVLTALAPALEAIGDALAASAPALGDLAAAAGEIIKALTPVLPLIGDLVASLVKALAPVLPVVASAIAEIAKAIVPLIPIVVQIAQAMGEQLGAEIAALAPALLEIVRALGELLVALLPVLDPLLKLALLLLTKISVPVMVKVAEAIALVATALVTIIDKVTELVGWLKTLTWDDLKNGARDAANAVGDWFSKLPERVREFFLDLPDKVATALLTVADKIGEFGPKVAEKAVGLFGALVEEARKTPGRIMEQLRKMPGRLAELLPKVLEGSKKIGGEILKGIGKGIAGTAKFVGEFSDAIRKAMVKVINGLVDLLNEKIPDKLGKGLLSISLPKDPIPRLKAAQGALVRARPGGVLANIAEGGYDEVVMSTNPAMAARNRQLLRQSGLGAQLAGGAQTAAGPVIDVGGIVIKSDRDGRVHAMEFIDQTRTEMFLAGAGAP
jgi:phage-related protein